MTLNESIEHVKKFHCVFLMLLLFFCGFYLSEQRITLPYTSLQPKEGLTGLNACLLGAIHLEKVRQVFLGEFSYKEGQDVQLLHRSCPVSF